MSTRIKYEVAPEFKEFDSWISHLHSDFSNSGETIFKLRNEVKVFKVGDQRLNVKAFKVPNLINRFVYVYFRGSKAERSYRYARKFLSLGIETPRAVGFAECTENGLLTKSYYVSLHLSYNYTLREVLDFQIELRDEILKKWVLFTYEKLHKNGIFHLDYSPGNTLITKKNGQYQFSVVDLNRMTFGYIDLEKGLSNFCRIEADSATLRLIGREYALLRGENPEEAARMILDIYHKGGNGFVRLGQVKDAVIRIFKSGRGEK